MSFEDFKKNRKDPIPPLSATEAAEMPEPAREKIVSLPEIMELEKPVQNIISKLKERIEGGEYGLIIGDDASGRIPALILGGFIKHFSALKNMRVPHIVFIPGRLKRTEGDAMPQELEKYLLQNGVAKDDRILIVTEIIRTGKSLSVLAGLLKDLNFKTDIATIGLDENMAGVSLEATRKENLGVSEIISGDYEREEGDQHRHTPLIYKKQTMGAVDKKPGDVHSQSLISRLHYFGFDDAEYLQEVQREINATRLEAGILTERLVEWYLSSRGQT